MCGTFVNSTFLPSFMAFYHLYTSLLSLVCSFHSCYQDICSLFWYMQYSLMVAFIIHWQCAYSIFLWSCPMLIKSRVWKLRYNYEACSSRPCGINFDHLGSCSWSQACKCSCFRPWNWNGILRLSSTTSTTPYFTVQCCKSEQCKTNLNLSWNCKTYLVY